MKGINVSSTYQAINPVKLWKQVEKELDRMTPEEKIGPLVDAGILTKGGNPTKPYREMFAEGARQARANRS